MQEVSDSLIARNGPILILAIDYGELNIMAN
jgi:hypothetical protein